MVALVVIVPGLVLHNPSNLHLEVNNFMVAAVVVGLCLQARHLVSNNR